MSLRIDGDVYATGRISAPYITYPANQIQNAAVASDAAIAASKLQHQHQPAYAQPNAAAVDETRVLHVIGAIGTVVGFKAGSIAKAVGNAVCTVDLKKNGTTILSSPITLDSSSANYTPQSATIAAANVVSGDVLTVVVDGTIGTGTLPTGVYCSVTLREDAA